MTETTAHPLAVCACWLQMQAQAHKLSEQSLSAALHAAQLQCTVPREDAATSFYGASHHADVTNDVTTTAGTTAGAAAGGAETMRAKLLATVKARTGTAADSAGTGSVYTVTTANGHCASKHSSKTEHGNNNSSDDSCTGNSSQAVNSSAAGSSSVRTKRSTRVHRSAVRHSSGSSSSSANNCSDGTAAASDDVCDDVCADVAAADRTGTGRASTRKQQQHSPAQQSQRAVKAALQSSVSLLRAANSAVDSRDTQDYSDHGRERESDLLLTVAGSSAVQVTMRSSGGRQSASLQTGSVSATGAVTEAATVQSRQQQQQQSTPLFELRSGAVVSEGSSNSADAHEAVPSDTVHASSRDSSADQQATATPTSRSNTIQQSTSNSSDVVIDVAAVTRHTSRSAALTGKRSNPYCNMLATDVLCVCFTQAYFSVHCFRSKLASAVRNTHS
jgi:trimeric autotransporter adhesin